MAELADDNHQSHLFKLIEDDINQASRIINNDFDIRHNTRLSENKTQRYALTKSDEIEYIYYRLYPLVIDVSNKMKGKIYG